MPENVASPSPRSKLKIWGKWCALVTILGALLVTGYLWWDYRWPQAPTEIFQGVTYGCDRLEPSEEGTGLVHWVRIDLTAPGIELFVTPLDRDALVEGWQYHLRRPHDVLQMENLSVVINATLFTSDSGWLRWPGDLANSVETVVADHEVSHVWEHTYLLGFDNALTPQLKPSKPPTAADLARAKWGIGGQGVGLLDGKVRPGENVKPDKRTAVAIDSQKKFLFLAVAESVKPHLLLQKLAELGAKDGMLLDGGGSSSMAIGPDAVGVRPGVVLGGWRPVATCFGIRARSLRATK